MQITPFESPGFCPHPQWLTFRLAFIAKKPVHHVQMTEGKRQIIQQLLSEYEIETAEDIQNALKDLLGGTIKEMMEAEMDSHLGYQNPSVLTTRTVVTATRRKPSTAVMAVFRLMSRRIANPPFSPR